MEELDVFDEAIAEGCAHLDNVAFGSEEYVNGCKAIAALRDARTNDYKVQAEAYARSVENEQKLKNDTKNTVIRSALDVLGKLALGTLSALLTIAIVKHDDQPEAGLVNKKAYDMSTKIMPK